MASVIKAGNATDGVQVTSDNTGILELKTGTGAGTTAMTVGTDQNVTFAQAANLPNTFGFKNRIINGNMVIDQRNAGASVTITNNAAITYTLDRQYAYTSVASKFSVQQNAGSVTPPTGFSNYLGVTSLSSYSVTSTDIFEIGHKVEGFNFADMAWGTASASTVTLSFWVRSSLTGTFGGAFRNSAGNRAYPFTYTISSANTWEQKTVTVAGDTTGTWIGATNGVGLDITFGLGVGANYSSTAGAWGATSAVSATGATSVVGTNGATFYITGVQLEKGSTATSFDYRPYGTELALCQRYYAKMSAAGKVYAGYATGLFASTTGGSIVGKYPVAMRSSPTIAASTCAVYDGNSVIAVTSLTTNYAGSDSFNIDFTVASGGTQFRPVNFVSNNSTAGFLEFSSEL